MSIEELEKKLIDGTISVDDLSYPEVKMMINKLKIDIEKKHIELDELNKEIKTFKTKIDNWGKNN